MTIKTLRAQHAHALKMLRVTGGNRGWARAVARLNAEIMKRSRPVKG
jgi:hypothetical protein